MVSRSLFILRNLVLSVCLVCFGSVIFILLEAYNNRPFYFSRVLRFLSERCPVPWHSRQPLPLHLL